MNAQVGGYSKNNTLVGQDRQEERQWDKNKIRTCLSMQFLAIDHVQIDVREYASGHLHVHGRLALD